MFMSEYYHSLDPKGRLIIPQKYREQLGDTFVVSRGMDHCLTIYTEEAWKKFTDKLASVPELSNPDARKVTRFFISGACEMETDKQGRILIPQSLRTFAGLDKDVVLAGLGSRIEIWDRKKWEEYNDYDDVESLAKSLEQYQI